MSIDCLVYNEFFSFLNITLLWLKTFSVSTFIMHFNWIFVIVESLESVISHTLLPFAQNILIPNPKFNLIKQWKRITIWKRKYIVLNDKIQDYGSNNEKNKNTYGNAINRSLLSENLPILSNVYLLFQSTIECVNKNNNFSNFGLKKCIKRKKYTYPLRNDYNWYKCISSILKN